MIGPRQAEVSLVPKMRRMFEKARSCEPGDGTSGSPSFSSFIAPLTPRVLRRSLSPKLSSLSALDAVARTSNKEADDSDDDDGPSTDGTMSVSSFVALPLDEQQPDKAAACHEKTGTASSLASNDASSSKKGGFVNKCVTKVKSMMAGGGSREGSISPSMAAAAAADGSKK